jgi:hypothetical protein
MSRGLSRPRMPVAVAVYLPEQYPRLLAIADDARDLETTWQEWYQVLQDTKRQMAAQGIHLIEIIVDLDALEKYCQEQGCKNTSSTRAQYAARLLSEQQQQQGPSQLHLPLKQRIRKKKRRML